MNPYIASLNQYLLSNTPDYGYTDVNTLLEMLYRFYTEYNPIENAVIQKHFDDFDDCTSRLTLEENNKLFNTVCGLCLEFQHQAFLTGIHIGLRLFSELNT